MKGMISSWSSMPMSEIGLATIGFALFIAAAASERPSPALLALLLAISTSSALAAWIRRRTDDSSSPSSTFCCWRNSNIEAGDGYDDGVARSSRYHLHGSRRNGDGEADIKTGSSTTDSAVAEESSERLRLLQRIDVALRPSRFAVLLIFAPAVALSILLLVRLLASPYHFGGVVSSLDFGPKYGNAGIGDDDAIEEVEANVAFTNEFNSYGHALQGILASLLAYPAMAGTLARLFDRRGPSNASAGGGGDAGETSSTSVSFTVVVLAELTSSFMTFYPSYNFFKRLSRHGDTFATSSFMNNGTEWTFGFVLGVSLGMLVTALVRRKLLASALEATTTQTTSRPWKWPMNPGRSDVDDRAESPLVYGKVEDFNVDDDASCCCRCVTTRFSLRVVSAIRWLLGLLFAVSVVLCAILMGYTWNSCAGGGDDCLNYVEGEQPPIGVVVGLGMVPIVVYGVAICVSRRY